MRMTRESMGIVVVGHVDHGKSTLIGRLLYDTQALPAGAIDKVQRICQDRGNPFEYAYLLDALEEEQKQGVTIDITHIQFFTAQRDYVIIDAPGHKEFLKNMISGAASAEAALLLIDAQQGIQEQSKRHGYMLSLLGIKKVCVMINKMDLVAYSQERFLSIKREMNQFLNSINIYPLCFIPISAFEGENITTHSERMPWYRHLPLLEALDQFTKEEGLASKPLRLPIQDVYRFDSRRIISGRMESGSLRVGDTVIISPGHKESRVKSIEQWPENAAEVAEAGMSVGITLADEFFNARGEIISHRADRPQVGKEFQANIFWLGKRELVMHKWYKLKLVTQETECRISAILKIIDAASLENLEQSTTVKLNDVAEVLIETKSPVGFDDFRVLPHTSRFVLVDEYDVSGGGIISGPAFQLGSQAGVTAEVPVETGGRVQRVSRWEREKKEGQRGRVIWLKGGQKNLHMEIGAKVERGLFELGHRVYYLEPAQGRDGSSDNLAQAERAVEAARVLAESGTIAIVTGHELLRDSIRRIIPSEDLLVAHIDGDMSQSTVTTDQKVEEIIRLAIS